MHTVKPGSHGRSFKRLREFQTAHVSNDKNKTKKLTLVGDPTMCGVQPHDANETPYEHIFLANIPRANSKSQTLLR